MKKLLTSLLIIVLGLSVHGTSINATSYNYNDYEQSVPSKDGFKVKENGVISGSDIIVTLPGETEQVTLGNIEDFFVTQNNYYIVDSLNARVAVLDKSSNVVKVIQSFEEFTDEGMVTHILENPRGIFVTDDNEMYITDYDNEAIYVLSDTYQLLKTITKPSNPTYGDYDFKVDKIVLDRTNRIYVTVGNVYDGIVEMTNDGIFSRFYGVQQVQVNPIDLLWRRLMTQDQLEVTVLFLPVEYTGMSIDKEGFIYATATSDSQTPIQRLNPKGSDVLRKNGYIKPIGDIVKFAGQEKSNFVGITVNEYGMYSVIDRANKKIFTYNDEGYLIYVTGMEGEFEGMFKYPTSIKYDDNELIVTDSELNTITFLTPTEFGEKVNNVIELSYNGEYLNITNLWQEIIDENTNFSYGYVGIGNALYREKDYKGAMTAFELGADKQGYGKAYEQYRKALLRNNFPIIGFSMVALIGITIIRPIVKDLRKGE